MCVGCKVGIDGVVCRMMRVRGERWEHTANVNAINKLIADLAVDVLKAILQTRPVHSRRPESAGHLHGGGPGEDPGNRSHGAGHCVYVSLLLGRRWEKMEK